jgi:hypothetical protein
MNTLNQRIQVDGEFVEIPRNDRSSSQIRHLLAGLEQQKEELGPIAVELIMLLNRLGVVASAASKPPQAGNKP